jgi:hypothetical protein
MVGASDVNSSSAYSSSSSSSNEVEGDRCKSKKSSKNLSGLSCYARDGFCGMARSSGSKKSHRSDFDSEDEVRDKIPFLREDNEHPGKLLDNRDGILREAKKIRKELRASLEDASNRVADLETQKLDAKLEIYSLKASPMVSDEIDCCDYFVYLVDLPSLKDEHASTCDELEWQRSGLTRTSTTLPMVQLSLVCRCPGQGECEDNSGLGRAEGSRWCYWLSATGHTGVGLEGSGLVFVLVRMLSSVLVVVVLVLGMESLQVVSLLDILYLKLNTRVGGFVDLRWRGGTVHCLPFMVFVLLQLDRGGSLVVVTVVVFVVVAWHWFSSFGTNPRVESFVHSRASF